MSIAMMTNVLCMLLCLAVLVQSVRMMRSLKAVKDGALTNVVTALDKATGQARLVLSEMKATLATDCVANARAIEKAEAIREELGLLIGLADATAERITAAASAANARVNAAALQAEPLGYEDAA